MTRIYLIFDFWKAPKPRDSGLLEALASLGLAPSGRRFSRPLQDFQARRKETNQDQERPIAVALLRERSFCLVLVPLSLVWAPRCTKFVPREGEYSFGPVQALLDDPRTMKWIACDNLSRSFRISPSIPQELLMQLCQRLPKSDGPPAVAHPSAAAHGRGVPLPIHTLRGPRPSAASTRWWNCPDVQNDLGHSRNCTCTTTARSPELSAPRRTSSCCYLMKWNGKFVMGGGGGFCR